MKKEIKNYEKVYVQIESKEDEKKWKKFLKKYFPNHYASSLLDDDLVIDVNRKNKGKWYTSKNVGVDKDGYGYIPTRYAYYGGYHFIKDFEEFKYTLCYRNIIKQGISYSQGEVEIININK